MNEEVNFDWEQVKENAQPLRRGRRAKDLRELLLPEDRDDLEEQRRMFEAQITANGGDDPLAVWIRYLEWTQKHLTAGRINLDRTRLLERCVRQFAKTEEYAQDLRYINICIEYAASVQKPLDIFEFYLERDIGSQSFRMWKAWALTLEHFGRVDEATAKFEQGLIVLQDEDQKQRLSACYADFELRQSMPKDEEDGDEEHEEQSNPSAPGTSRAAFNEVSAMKDGTAPYYRAGNLPSKGLGRMAAATKQGNTGKVTIFQDTAGEQPSMTAGGLRVWQDLPSESVAVKENAAVGASWDSQKGIGGKAKAPVMTINVFTDGPDAQQEQQSQAHVPDSVRNKLDKRALQPVKKLAEEKAFLRDYARERGICRDVTDDKGRRCYLGYDPKPLFPPHEEFCFEEIRCQRWLEEQQTSLQDLLRQIEEKERQAAAAGVSGQDMDVEMDCSDQQTEEQPETGSFCKRKREAEERDQLPVHGMREPSDENSAAFNAAETNPTTPRQVSKSIRASTADKSSPEAADEAVVRQRKRSVASPTINTKAAMADVLAMFGTDLDKTKEDEGGDEDTTARFEESAMAQSVQSGANSSMAQPSSRSAFMVFQDENASGKDQENQPPAAYSQPDQGVVAGLQQSQEAPSRNPLQSIASVPSVENGVEDYIEVMDAEPEETADVQRTTDAAEDNTQTGRFNITAFSQANSTDLSLLHSTPFPGTQANARPIVTPIHSGEHRAAPTFNVHDTTGGMASAEQSTHCADSAMAAKPLSPIMEMSGESSNSSRASRNDSSRHSNMSSFSGMASAAEAVPQPACSSAQPDSTSTVSKMLQQLQLNEVPNLTVMPVSCPLALEEDTEIQGVGPFKRLRLETLVANGDFDEVEADVLVAVELVPFEDETGETVYDEGDYFMVKRTSSVWEFAMQQKIHQALESANVDKRVGMSIAKPVLGVKFQDCLVSATRADIANLADVAELMGTNKIVLSEPAIMFFAIELLRVVDALHTVGFAHCNLAGETVFVRNDTVMTDEAQFSDSAPTGDLPAWVSDGSSGWHNHGVRLHGMHRVVPVDGAKQLSLQDVADRTAAVLQSMGQSTFSFERGDYIGIADVIHQLLHFCPLEVAMTDDGLWMPRRKVKAFMQAPMWDQLFKALLNSQDGTRVLAAQRQVFETYLTRNKPKASLIHSNLIKLEIRLTDEE